MCVAPTGTLGFVDGGGGHLWAYLNWALGLRALGCRVIWLEWVASAADGARMRAAAAALDAVLARAGIELALGTLSAEPRPPALRDWPDVAAAAEADLLLNFRYALDPAVVRRFRRSALVDIDPGLLQIWMTEGQLAVAAHDLYFTIGETVGRPGAGFPDAGLRWHYTPPPVFLDAWPPTPAPAGAPYTTVSNWWGEWVKWQDDTWPNDKRTSFLEFADLPRRTAVTLELALYLSEHDGDDRRRLEDRGWRVRPVQEVCRTVDDYQRYVRRSRGEFSCAKPSCMRLRNAWVSDRTLCYLASGKPAVVQHTGPSRLLPDACGLFRFRDLDEAARHLAAVEADYERQCREARRLAVEHFDAVAVARRVLETALG